MATGTLDERMAELTSSGVPSIYFNGFAAGASSGDIICILERNGASAAVLNMSYTVAKTLSIQLGRMIAQIEEAASRDIMTTHEVDAFLSKQPGEAE